MKLCSVKDCGKERKARGYCSMHYWRLNKHGDVNYYSGVHNGDAMQFFQESLKIETNECIIWKFYKTSSGHGQIRFNSRNKPVHSLALTIRVGEHLPDKPNALHKPLICHNPSCFNYRHLYWGNQKDNVNDARIDGTTGFGEKAPTSKIKEYQAIAIIADPRLHKTIAVDYGVSRATIGDIKNGNSWNYLERSNMPTFNYRARSRRETKSV